MKKLNKKGFMLTETLIASTLLITVLLIMYLQFRNVLRSYQRSFTYNTVNDLYALYNVKKYLEKENYPAMASRLDSSKYVELNSCNTLYYSNKAYCEELYYNLNIEKLYLVKENLQVLKNNTNLDSDIMNFIKTIKNTTGNGYRLIAKFYGGTFSTLDIFKGTDYKAQITQSCNASSKVKYKINHIDQNTNANIKDSDLKNAQCGSQIDLKDYIYKDNRCVYSSGFSNELMTLTLDETGNEGTIFYKKYESKITIRYIEQGTSAIVSPSKVIDAYCGDKINAEDHIIKINNREYIRATQTSVDVDTSNVTIDLIYTIEGGTVHE